MKKVSGIRRPQWNEKRFLICKKCGNIFMGIIIPFFTKCPKCGYRRLIEDNRFTY